MYRDNKTIIDLSALRHNYHTLRKLLKPETKFVGVVKADGYGHGAVAVARALEEEGCDCSEVLVQLAAVRSALDNTGKVILKDHMRHCMVDAVAAGDNDAIDDLCEAIDKFVK